MLTGTELLATVKDAYREAGGRVDVGFADGAIEVEWAGGRGTERMTLRFAAGETELRRTDR